MDQIEITPLDHPHELRFSIRPPGSKSITNRALICAALAEGNSRLRGALDSEDTRVMVEALRQLGLAVAFDTDRMEIELQGCGGRLPVYQADLFLANSGTSIRFLTAMAALGQGEYRLDGIPRMRQRPIADLLHALEQLGANARSETGSGCPPVVVKAHGLAGGRATIAGNISSQFLSALLMAAPCAAADVELVVEGELVSRPYVTMTIAVMKAFGAEVHCDNFTSLQIPARRGYTSCDYAIEPDASAASYFWAAAAVSRGQVTVEGLTRNALQGDVAFCECLAQMGCSIECGPESLTVIGDRLNGIDVDMNAISDTVQTLAVVALFAEGPTRIRNVAHIRHKETDRIGDLARELRKLGATVNEFDDGLEIVPGELRPAVLETYNDHRMAMSFAVAGLRQAGIVIRDPGCTAKTYPQFFDDWQRLRNAARS